MITAKQLLAHAVQVLLTPRSAGVETILLLRYQPAFYGGAVAEKGFRLLEYAARAGRRVRLASDSARLARQLEWLTTLPVEVLPIPHTDALDAAAPAHPALPPRRPGRVRFASLGNARDEKGYLEILQAIRMLRAAPGGLDGLEFVLQSNDPQPDVAAAIAEFARDLPPEVTLLHEALPPDAYRALLASTDVVLLPYWRSIYEARTSGVFMEAMTAGKPVIATRDTWMSDESRGAGLLIADRSAEELGRAIRTAARNVGSLASATAAVAEECRRVHNAAALVACAAAPAPVRDRARPPRRVAVLYPWGDLLERRAGAAVRSAAMIEAVAAQVDEVRVLQPGSASGHLADNVRVEAFGGEPTRLQQLVRKGLTLLCRPLLGRRGRGQHEQLWFHLERRFDSDFRRRANELVRWADVVMLEYSYWGRIVLPLCREHGTPCIVTTHDVVSDQVTASALLRRATEAEMIWTLRRGDRAVCVSPEDAARFHRWGVSAAVVANPVDLARVDAQLPGDARRLVAELYDVTLPTRPFGLFVGSRYAPNIAAAECIRRLADASPVLDWVLAGGCAEPERADRLLALGIVDEAVLGLLYQLAAVVVIPLPHGTGTSLKTLEAMAAGKPVIGTTAGFRGLGVEPGRHCLVEDDVARYPAIIAELLANPERCRALGQEARAFAQRFDRWLLFQAYMPMLGLPQMQEEEIRAAQDEARATRELGMLRQLASRAVDSERDGPARELLAELSRRAPNDPDAKFLLGRTLARDPVTMKPALDHLRQAEALGFDPFRTRLAMADAYAVGGDAAASRQAMERAVEARVTAVVGPAQFDRFVMDCWELYREGKLRLVAWLAAGMVRQRSNAGLHFLAAHSRHQLGEELEAAVGHYEAAQREGFDAFWTSYHLGRLNQELGRRSGAQTALFRALAVAPSEGTRAMAAACLLEEARCELDALNHEGAVTLADRLIADGLELPRAHQVAARARHAAGGADERTPGRYGEVVAVGPGTRHDPAAPKWRAGRGADADVTAADIAVAGRWRRAENADEVADMLLEQTSPCGTAGETRDPAQRCPVCGCEDAAVAGFVRSRPILICRACRHLRWLGMPKPDELRAFYATAYTSTHGQLETQEGQLSYYRGHVSELAALATTAPGGRPVEEVAIADIGCSYPVLLALAVEAGCRRAIGVDWSEEAREYGARRGVQVMTPEAFLREVPDSSLDVLRYSHTLEHLVDPVATLRAQIAKLRPGGLLYITQPNTPMLRFGAAPAPFDAVYPNHLHFFTPASLVALAEDAGCTVERFYTVGEPEAVSAHHRLAFDVDFAVSRLNMLEGRGEEVRGPLNNFPFFFGRNSALYARRAVTGIMPPSSEHRDPVARFLAEVVRPGDVVFDVGANAGEMTRALAHSAAQVVAFEPNPRLAAALRDSVPPNVRVVEKAVSSAAGRMPFFLDVRADGLGLASSLMRLDDLVGETEEIEVEVTTIDAFVRESGLRPAIIKVDVEGFEPEVLAGAEEVIDRDRPTMVLELWESHWLRYRERLLSLQDRYEFLRLSDRRSVFEVYGSGPMHGMDNILCMPKQR